MGDATVGVALTRAWKGGRRDGQRTSAAVRVTHAGCGVVAEDHGLCRAAPALAAGPSEVAATQSRDGLLHHGLEVDPAENGIARRCRAAPMVLRDLVQRNAALVDAVVRKLTVVLVEWGVDRRSVLAPNGDPRLGAQ